MSWCYSRRQKHMSESQFNFFHFLFFTTIYVIMIAAQDPLRNWHWLFPFWTINEMKMNWVHFLCAPCSVCTNENDSWHSFSQMSKNMRIAYHAGIYAVTNVNSGSCHNWKDSTTIRCESGIGHYWISYQNCAENQVTNEPMRNLISTIIWTNKMLWPIPSFLTLLIGTGVPSTIVNVNLWVGCLIGSILLRTHNVHNSIENRF